MKTQHYLIISIVLVVILVAVNFIKIYIEINEVILFPIEIILLLIAGFSFCKSIKNKNEIS